MASESPLTHPEEWPVVRLADITLKIGSGATPRGGAENYLPQRTGFALIRSQNVFDRYFDYSGLAFISDAQASELQNVIVRPGDLLLNITGDGVTFSRCCAAPVDVLPACVNQHVSIIRVDPTLADPGYVLAFLTHPIVKSYIESFNAGGSRRAITKGHIESFRLPLPPIYEQRLIAHILEALDDKIELHRKLNGTLEAMARTIFKSWFVDFDPVRAKAEGRGTGLSDAIAALFPDSFDESILGEIPIGWRLGKLDGISQTVLGGDWGSEHPDESKTIRVRCIRGADIPELQAGGIGKMPLRYIRQASAEKRILNDGDLVIEISGGSPTQSTGRPVLISNGLLRRIDAPLTCSNFCRMLRLKSANQSKFVYLWLRDLYQSDKFLQYENGTTGIKNFAFTLFSSTQIMVLPSTALFNEFERMVTPLFQKMNANAEESDTLTALRDELLPRLISGEVRLKQNDSAYCEQQEVANERCAKP